MDTVFTADELGALALSIALPPGRGTNALIDLLKARGANVAALDFDEGIFPPARADKAHVVLGFKPEFEQCVAQLDVNTVWGATLAQDAAALGDVRAVHLGKSDLRAHFEDYSGAGQAGVMTFLDITNLQLAGRSALVLGFDTKARGVAACARALGAQVSVVDDDPRALVQAVARGYAAQDIKLALPGADIILCVRRGALQTLLERIEVLQPGAFVVNVADDAYHDFLGRFASIEPLRESVHACRCTDGKSIRVIAGARPLADAPDGLPLECLDVVFALHLCALRQILDTNAAPPQVTPLEAKYEKAVAEILLSRHRRS
ncbi:MAG: hypothetical protein AAF862_12100 [Pseudomonadota bacterium]